MNFINTFGKKVIILIFEKKLSMLEWKLSSHISQTPHHPTFHSPIAFTFFLKVSTQIAWAFVNKPCLRCSLKRTKCSCQNKVRSPPNNNSVNHKISSGSHSLNASEANCYTLFFSLCRYGKTIRLMKKRQIAINFWAPDKLLLNITSLYNSKRNSMVLLNES